MFVWQTTEQNIGKEAWHLVAEVHQVSAYTCELDGHLVDFICNQNHVLLLTEPYNVNLRVTRSSEQGSVLKLMPWPCHRVTCSGR